MTVADGIILRRTPYLSSGIILDVLTPSGKLPVLLRGVKGGKSSSKHSETQVGSFVRLVLHHPHGPEAMHTVKEISADVRSADVSSIGPYRAAQLLFICELTASTVQGRESGGELYEFLYQCIRSLCQGSERHLCMRYSYHLAQLLGFAPGHPDGQGQYFDLQAGEFLPDRPLHRYYLTPANASLFFSLGDASREPVFSDASQYLKLWHIIVTYYSLHIEGFRPPRSLDFLQQLTLMEYFPPAEKK